MALFDQKREQIHESIEKLKPESLEQLEVFIAYLQWKETHPGSAWFRVAYQAFTPVRDAAANMTEDEINQMIADAIEEVRHGDNT